MQSEDVLEECLKLHKDLLRLEQGFHAWLSEMTGVEVAS